MQGAEVERAPVILQISQNAIRYRIGALEPLGRRLPRAGDRRQRCRSRSISTTPHRTSCASERPRRG